MSNGAPTASIGGENPTVWSNERFFVDCMMHCITCKRPLKEDPILLILDSHEFHLSISAINVAKENGSFLLTLPHHTLHKLLPLDWVVFGPYRTYQNVCHIV
jgi:DDE superfamily endonuclease.